MTKTKVYRYIGRNGIVTTPILLDDIKYYLRYRLKADEGKILTNGLQRVHAIEIDADELDDWYELFEDNSQ